MKKTTELLKNIMVFLKELQVNFLNNKNIRSECMRNNKKSIVILSVIAVLAIALTGYISYCLGGSMTEADILSENGGADKFKKSIH